MIRFLPVVLLAALVAGCTSASPGTTTATTTATTASTTTEQDVQERWWTWAASSPDDRNPVVDTTGEFCAADQPTDVWFVAGTFGGAVERTCEVPAGRPIVGPVVNYVEDTQDGCTARTTGAEGEVTLDGRPQEVERLGPTRVTVRGAAGNAVTGEEGAFRAYACGLWVRIPPLAPGEHDLLIDGRSGDFHTSAHYRLLVRASND